MKFLNKPQNIAGLMSLLAAVLILPFWYILLFVAQPSNTPALESAIYTLSYMFSSENPTLTYVIWHAAALLALIVLGGVYLSSFARSQFTAKILFGFSLALGISAFFYTSVGNAIFVLLPCYWGYLYLSSLTPHSSGTPNGAP